VGDTSGDALSGGARQQSSLAADEATDTGERLVPAPAAAALLAYFLIAIGTTVGGAERLALGIPVAAIGFATACAAAFRMRRPGPAWRLAPLFTGLCAMTAAGIVVPPRDHPSLWYQIVHRLVPVCGVLIVGTVAGPSRRAARIAVWTAIALATGLQILTVIAIPRPFIDVWSWTDAAARALLDGSHPYTAHPPDIYRGGLEMGYTSTVYPYMPLTVVAHALSLAVFGDYRVGMAMCLLGSAGLLRATARRLAVDDVVVDVLTLALVFYPRAAYVVGSGYNEPLLILTAAIFVFLAARSRYGSGAAVAFMLLPALKQYFVGPPIAYAIDLWRRHAYKPLLIGTAGALGTVAPFVLWNPQATVAGILFQARPAVAFRPDSVSLTALVAALTGIEPAPWLPEMVQLTMTAAMFWWLRDCGLGGVLLASAVALTASFLVGKQAFANNYEFAAALLLLAALVLARRDAPA
jgi:hypothetical protein